VRNVVMLAMASLNERAFAEGSAREPQADSPPSPAVADDVVRPRAEDSIARGIVDAVLEGAADELPAPSPRALL
jgi:hypothetical protein